MSSCAPVLLVAWKRPDTLKKVIASIRVAAPGCVYIACDGPRLDQAAEVESVREVRRTIDLEIDWPCRVEKLYSDVNYGCRRSVSKAITWFFENEKEGIILEDDCVPHQDFYSFCSELLEHYREDARVWVVTGNNFQDGRKHGVGSYYFSRYPHCWGWATWRRAWSNYSADFDFWPNWKRSQHWRGLRLARHERLYWESILDKVYAGQLDSWACPWLASVWKGQGLTATPQENLVTNIGFGSEATHTKRRSSTLNMPTTGLGLSIIHPAAVSADHDADNYVFQTVFKGGGRKHENIRDTLSNLWRRIRNKSGQPNIPG
jgi:GR25 family glycosyltransferase involved in LPS biosynthesis